MSHILQFITLKTPEEVAGAAEVVAAIVVVDVVVGAAVVVGIWNN